MRLALPSRTRAKCAHMKFLNLILAVATVFAFSACCTGIVTRTVPAKSCCASDGKCVVKAKHHKH